MTKHGLQSGKTDHKKQKAGRGNSDRIAEQGKEKKKHKKGGGGGVGGGVGGGFGVGVWGGGGGKLKWSKWQQNITRNQKSRRAGVVQNQYNQRQVMEGWFYEKRLDGRLGSTKFLGEVKTEFKRYFRGETRTRE